MEEPTGLRRLEGMSEEFDEAGPEEEEVEEVEAHAADVADEPDDSDDDSDFEGHLFQRR